MNRCPMNRLGFPAIPLLLLVGCGQEPHAIAPVSGRVTLNGKPLPNAGVTFSPMPAGAKVDAGPGSAGVTDADGHYTLKLVGKPGKGAVIGKHKVSIIMMDDDDPNDDRPKRQRRPQLPAKYNGHTTLGCDVSSGGTDKADFELKVP